MVHGEDEPEFEADEKLLESNKLALYKVHEGVWDCPSFPFKMSSERQKALKKCRRNTTFHSRWHGK